MPRNQTSRNDALVIVLSVALVAGMAIAVLLIAVWRNHPAAIAQDTIFRMAVAVCPPFMLVRAVGGVDDTTLALILTAGTIVFANGFLYSGLAAFVFWGLTTFWPHNKPH